jgi:hypothetical protein
VSGSEGPGTPLPAARLVLAAIAAWAVIAVIGLASGPLLGHDESAFLVLARGGGPATWMYRSSGVIALAKLGLVLGHAEWLLRLPSALVGLGVPVATWAVGRRAFGERTGAWAAAVIAGAHPMVLRASELLGDLPATACVLAGIAVIVRELDGDDRAGASWRLLAAAPAFAGAFYLRYGSAPVIAIAGAAATALWPRAIVRRPLPVLGTAVAFAALLAPHAVHSLHTTGEILGILEYSSQMPRRAYFGEGLVTYVTANPLVFYGAIVAPLAIAGLVAIVRPAPGRRRATWYLGAIAVGQLVAIGLQSHAQPRYVFVATTLLVVLGVDLVRRTLRPRPRAGLAVVVVSWVGCAAAVIPYNLHLTHLRAPLVAAAEAIRADAHGDPCLVVARVVTQLAWYTGCDTQLLRDPEILDLVPDGVRGYLASVPHGTAKPDVVAATLHRTAWPIATHDALSQVWQLR